MSARRKETLVYVLATAHAAISNYCGVPEFSSPFVINDDNENHDTYVCPSPASVSSFAEPAGKVNPHTVDPFVALQHRCVRSL